MTSGLSEFHDPTPGSRSDQACRACSVSFSGMGGIPASISVRPPVGVRPLPDYSLFDDPGQSSSAPFGQNLLTCTISSAGMPTIFECSISCSGLLAS